VVSSQAAALLRGRQRQMRGAQVVLDLRHARQPLRGRQQQFARLGPLACVEGTLGPV